MATNFQVSGIELSSLKQAPIHVSGQIQPHGVLFVLQEPELKILQFSSNVPKIFGIAAEDIIGKNLDEVLDTFQVEKIKAGISADSLDFINPTKLWVRKAGDDYLVFDGVLSPQC